MKKGFSLIELIISIGIISIISGLTFFALKGTNISYADPYENIRLIISDATRIFLNSNVGIDYKNELHMKKEIIINTNFLINEGLIEESYYIENIGEVKNIENCEIIVSIDEEGFINYSINIV